MTCRIIGELTANARASSMILIEFYDETCEPGVNCDKPKRRYVCESIAEAVMALGLIERHETLPTEDEVNAEKTKDF